MKVSVVCIISCIGIVQRLSVLCLFNTRTHGSFRQSSEFGVIRRLWRRSMDHCLLYDSRMVSLNLFEYGKCRLVAVSAGEHDSFRWKWLFEICSDFLVHWLDRWWTNENPTDLELAPFFRGFVDVESGWISVLCPFFVLFFLFVTEIHALLKQVF